MAYRKKNEIPKNKPWTVWLDQDPIELKAGARISTAPVNSEIETSDVDVKYRQQTSESFTTEEDLLLVKKSLGKRTLFDGRYVAVSSWTFAKFKEDGWCILANKRGPGVPDYKGCWNSVCGFLEANESGEEGCAREVLEETGIKVDPSRYRFVGVQTEPELCNNGNVSLRYVAFLDPEFDDLATATPAALEGGEVDEVENIKWIPLKEIDNYEWAFDHKDLIIPMFKKMSLKDWFNTNCFILRLFKRIKMKLC